VLERFRTHAKDTSAAKYKAERWSPLHEFSQALARERLGVSVEITGKYEVGRDYRERMAKCLNVVWVPVPNSQSQIETGIRSNDPLP
jgi:hypothetical protein